MGWEREDIAQQATVDEAIRPIDMRGDSIVWKAGVLWDRCPRWHLEHGPYARVAGSLVARIDRVRKGLARPPAWTKAGALLVDTDSTLRSWLESDRVERRMPKPKKGA